MSIILECMDCHKLLFNAGKHDRETGHKAYKGVGTTETGIMRECGI